MKIHLCGAAGEVTGSGYLVETSRARVLVDFGMFQGRKSTEARNVDLGPVDPKRIDAVVLTHAHLDHSGRLPLLTRGGYRGPVHATPATIDFTKIILADSARIQESDAERENRVRERAGRPLIDPLYLRGDAEAVDELYRPLPYGESREVADGVEVRFVDAGHILGSASIEMTVRDGAETRVIAFSGDIGQRDVPFLRNPVPLEHADLVFLESTYGDHDHRPLDATVDEFQQILKEQAWGRAKVLIPAFAIGRTQQVLFYIAELLRDERVPSFPIYLDSPMAIAATKVYAQHQHLFDEEAKDLVARRRFRTDLRTLEFVETAAESRELNNMWEGCVIIAGSGMCTGGRIMHHLKHNLWRRNVSVLMVGYMSKGTLGRRLIDGVDPVRIYGARIAVRASIHTLGGFSAHAGQSELVDWAAPTAAHKARFGLTHGEDEPRAILATKLAERYGVQVERPGRGAVVEV